jgi:conjugal transfer mating pair stabilization protein TraG
MVNQVIQQRNMQQAAKQNMLMTVVRLMITFFEGFIYAITPIMAFMIVMGSVGLKLADMYAQTILWIQLWLPVLSSHETNTQSNVAIEFRKLNLSAADPTARLQLNVRLKGGNDLEKKTGNPVYHGWIVEDIGTTDL